MKKIYIGLIALAVFLTFPLVFFSPAASAVEYTFTTIDVPVPGSSYIFATGINDYGDIVGSYGDPGAHGFLYAEGVFTTIDLFANTWPNGINNSGDIVGYGMGPWYYNFLYSGGTTTTFVVPGSYWIWGADGINDLGDIVGSYGTETEGLGFLYSGGIFTMIHVPGADDGCWTAPKGINNSGAIVGIYNLPDAPSTHRGFLYAGGNFTLIDVPGATGGTDVNGINDYGDIVGQFYNANRGFLYSGGIFTTVHVPGATSTAAFGINNSGSIVGTYADATGSHGFIATPIPEPVSIDIRPDSINVRKSSLITVAILSTEDFDAVNRIHQESLTFGRTGSEDSLAYCKSKPRDLNEDGFKDLLCYFYIDHTGFHCGYNLGIINGYAVGGVPIIGTDSARLIQCK